MKEGRILAYSELIVQLLRPTRGRHEIRAWQFQTPRPRLPSSLTVMAHAGV